MERGFAVGLPEIIQVGQSQCALFLKPIVTAHFTDLLPHQLLLRAHLPRFLQQSVILYVIQGHSCSLKH